MRKSRFTLADQKLECSVRRKAGADSGPGGRDLFARSKGSGFDRPSDESLGSLADAGGKGVCYTEVALIAMQSGASHCPA